MRTFNLRQMFMDGGYSYASGAPGALRAQMRVWADDLDGPLRRDSCGCR